MRALSGLVTCLFVFSGVAEAARLASPPIFGAHTQVGAICAVFNNGTEPIDVVVTILGESGEKLRSQQFTRVLPRQTVSLSQSLEDRFGVAHACTVDAASVATLRASLSITEHVNADGTNFRVFRSVPLR
jgi:hypothetical protein